MVKVATDLVCRSCEPDTGETSGSGSVSRILSPWPAEVDDLPTTDNVGSEG